MTASLLTAVVGTRGQTRVALTADHLLAVVLLGESSQGGLDHTTSHLEEHLKGGLSSNGVGTDGLRVLELLAGEHQALVLVVDVLLLLEHLLHVLHGLRGLDIKRDGISLHRGENPIAPQSGLFSIPGSRTYSNGLDKDLHTVTKDVRMSLYARTTRSLEVKRPVVSPDNLPFCELYSWDTMNIEVGCGL